ncbi:MAG: PEP-CTERM sorting domain-containing protein [Planctomycetota bacterium]
MHSMRYRCLVVFSGLFLTAVWSGTAVAQIPQISSGPNTAILPPLVQYPVDFDPDLLTYNFEADLIFSPFLPPMTKFFPAPYRPDPTGGTSPIVLDPAQPLPFPVWEDFHLVPGTPGGPPSSGPVSDWHEEILTPGWEWVRPDDPRVLAGEPGFDGLFPAGQTLITRNGQPWDSQPIPHPGGPDPTKIWEKFPPIFPGETLDIHKALLWVGTPDNEIWGDGVDNAGNTIIEEGIVVLEYPTPEPGTFSLLALGVFAGVCRRSRV